MSFEATSLRVLTAYQADDCLVRALPEYVRFAIHKLSTLAHCIVDDIQTSEKIPSHVEPLDRVVITMVPEGEAY